MAKTKAEIQKDYAKRSGYAANAKYNRDKTTVCTIRLITATEQDIIKRLENVGNKSGYIKRLIREDIAKANNPLE